MVFLLATADYRQESFVCSVMCLNFSEVAATDAWRVSSQLHRQATRIATTMNWPLTRMS